MYDRGVRGYRPLAFRVDGLCHGDRGVPAAPTGPGDPDGHLTNTHNVIRYK
jgi:hypothetical protein